jgi:hypothetical protein
VSPSCRRIQDAVSLLLDHSSQLVWRKPAGRSNQFAWIDNVDKRQLRLNRRRQVNREIHGVG